MSFLTQNNGTLGEPDFEEHIYSDALEDDLTTCRSIIKTGDNEGLEYKLAKLENPTLFVYNNLAMISFQGTKEGAP